VKYTIWALDVWGHGPADCAALDANGECSHDGYYVNDRRKIGTIDIVEGMTDDALLALLDTEGYVHAGLCVFDAQGDESCYYVESKADGRPLLQLEKVQS